MSNLKYWVWLSSAKGMHAAAAQTLLARFGGPREIFFAPGTELEALNLKKETVADLRARDLTRAEQILADCARENIRVLVPTDAEYPERLRNISDPPTVLYVKGRLPVMDDEAAIAVVGAREATPYGLMTAEKFGAQIVEHGGIVVSGLARGVDAAGHRGALMAGGMTVAVLGCGVDVVYPKEHRRLYADIEATGAVVSEYPPGTEPLSWHFPERNRIISGLSVGVVVVEASRRSGSLRTVNHALDQGRQVFAVPGNVDAENSQGCNDLIREGAAPATCGWDILQEFVLQFPHRLTARPKRKHPPVSGQLDKGPPPQAAAPEETPPLKRKCKEVDLDALSQDEACVYRLLLEGTGMQVDDIVEAAQIPTGRVLAALTMLELDGAVIQNKNKKFSAWAEQQ